MASLTQEDGVTPLLDESALSLLLDERPETDLLIWTDGVATRTVGVSHPSGTLMTTVQSSADDYTPDPLLPPDAP